MLSPSPSDATSSAPDVWTPSSWRLRPAEQQPSWPDAAAADRARSTLTSSPPIVPADEVRALSSSLAAAASGGAFLLQGGDCAETFDAGPDEVREKLRVLLQMNVVLVHSAGVPVVKVGRMAGQYGKPRSSGTEVVGGVELPSFRGHIVNGDAPDAASRAHDPERMVRAYHHSAATLSLLRSFSRGDFADLEQVNSWNREFLAGSPAGRRFDQVAAEIDRALRFMHACGVKDLPTLHHAEVYTSHEALVLDYEESLLRRCPSTGGWYDSSAHMVWIGERTRQLDGAHVEFASGISNPVGVKVGPSTSPEEVIELCERLNPARVPGRLTLISRMGADRVEDALRPLLRTVSASGHPVVWACDPMHGNTFSLPSGRKTRHFDRVMSEVSGFFAAHEAEGTMPGGVHVELTGDPVTECLGGSDGLDEASLEHRYETTCDPRLNARQAVELAFEVGELLRVSH